MHSDTVTEDSAWMVVWTTLAPPEETVEFIFGTKHEAQVFKAEHPLGKYASVIRIAQ